MKNTEIKEKPSQGMNFKELYSRSKVEIEEAIMGYWEENTPNMVEKYKEQFNDILASFFGENIVVENMAHWTALDEKTDWTKIVNPSIWRKWKKGTPDDKKGRTFIENAEEIPFRPYQHQYDSWHALLEDDKSIVVTSGTGSGKTECFMVPLIHDLTKEQGVNGTRTKGIEAIFLYPLNALMEDQKERINNYITFSEKDLKFAVYNGNTPENENDERYDEDAIFENEIVTREKIRSEKPNILFTNPSMLEYMLLRAKDKPLFSKDLKWIVIDETHTYKGAAAAELAMLLRRVLNACGIKNVNKIKFATSSATIGDDKEAEKDLLQFISDITGQETGKIRRIAGSRSMPNTADEDIQKKLKENDFIFLKDLINDDRSIEDKLALLDDLSDKGKDHNLRIRLHYYLQTLNGGLYVDLRKLQDDNTFKLYKSIPLVDGKLDTHFLEAYYCKKCGALVGYGELLDNDNICDYSLKTREIIDSLEGEGDDDENNGDNGDNDNNTNNHQTTKEFYIGIAKEGSLQKCSLTDEGKLNKANSGKFAWKEIEKKDGKDIHWCPCCGAHGSEQYNPLRSFHMSADFISRLIAPILLSQTTPAEENQDTLPSKGCKYITFADSRQGSAGPSLKQNLETEEVWVAGVIFNRLLELKPLTDEDRQKLRHERDLAEDKGDKNEAHRITDLLTKKEHHITWNEALDLLLKDKNFDQMHLAFVSPDTQIYELDKNRYVTAALYRVMNRRPSGGANSPENCGLFCTTYPALEELRVRELPEAIENLNALITSEDNKIKPEDWYDFVKLFIDLNIRTNGSLYFDRKEDVNEDWDKIDFKDCRGFKTEHYSRRPVDGEENPIFGENTRYTQLLTNLLGKRNWKELDDEEKDVVRTVAKEQLKADLMKYGIIQKSESIKWRWRNREKIYDHWEKDKDKNGQEIYYMNLTKIAFKLYDEEVWFDENLCIPLDTTFKGYSPYKNEENRFIRCNRICWPAFNKEDKKNCKEWFMTNRECISKKWTSKLGRTLEYSSEDPNTLYIQAEHTAQVARSIIKKKTEKFKKGEINIMACSTTMEMGVDLGDLELVVMNNVPPQPANYKQRAGRAGRGDQTRSACFTICGTDATGEAMMANPLKSLINYPIQPPKVDMHSKQLIQRHINSFLLRKSGVLGNSSPGADAANDRGIQLCHMFTNYETHRVEIKKGQNNIWISQAKIKNGEDITPKEYISLINQSNTLYQQFIDKLGEYEKDNETLEEIRMLATNSSNSNPDAVELIKRTKEQITAVAEYIDKQFKGIQKLWEDNKCDINNDKLGRLLNYSFTSLLKKNLLGYLSTHQFTPNANMPVGIVEMLIKKSDDYGRSENPTRDMRVALSEYAPGRMVFVNGTTYVMGGVDWNRSQSMQYAKHCSDHHVWIGENDSCPICGKEAVEWEQPFGKKMPILTPTGFYPCKETTRITKKNYEDLVISTELINARNWESNNKGNRLYAVRVNEDGPGSEILYYNKGLGKGYYVCNECGYAVPVPLSTSGQTESDIIINSIYHEEEIKKNGDCTKYHNYRGFKCEFDNSQKNDKILKNVVFGGTIQTDYCEIALISKTANTILDEEVAITLGLMLCKELSRKISCERSDIDFIPRKQNNQRSICIYDTAKGGAGYSKQLRNIDLLEELFNNIREQLNGCTSAEKVLDRMTMKYANKIDIKKTYEWLKDEFEYRKEVDKEIQAKFNDNSNVIVSCYENIRRVISNPNEECKLFFNGRLVKKWNFNNGELNWQVNRSYELGDNRNKTYAVYNLPSTISSCDKEKMSLTSAGKKWERATFNINGIYPLAMVGKKLYFTTNIEYSTINENWGFKDVYCVDYDNIDICDLKFNIISDKHYTYKSGVESGSDKLFEELYNNSEEVRNFIECSKNSKLSFKYHEEYLRTHLNMTIALQFMLKFAERANAKIEMITCIGEKYEDKYSEKKFPDSYDYRTGDPRKLFAACLNDRRRDEYLETKFLDSLKANGIINDFKIESLKEDSLPHWRALIVENSKKDIINILPNGGFGNGWEFDKEAANQPYYPNNCDIKTSIPIKSGKTKILYDIKVGPFEDIEC